MANIDSFCGRIKPHPFPNDYNFDDADQRQKALDRFFNPMKRWGGDIFLWYGYRDPGEAFQIFVNYYSKAFDSITKRAKMISLFDKHLSDDDLEFTLKDLAKQTPSIITDIMSFVKSTKSVEGAMDFAVDRPGKKIKRILSFVVDSGYYDREKAVGGAIQQVNKKLGGLAVLGRLAIGDIPGAAIDVAASLFGQMAGRSVGEMAQSAEVKERFMAHMKHYILENKINFDEFAEIIFDATDIKKN